MSIYVKSFMKTDGWLPVGRHLFRGGEISTKLPKELPKNDAVFVDILCHATEHFSPMELVLTADAIKRSGNFVGDLYLPYLPYARQDRVCNEGEALSSKVMADLINMVGADRVYTIDPHSDVMPAMINNLVRMELPTLEVSGYDAIVAPDAGAAKKVFSLAQKYNKEFIQGMKHRDLKTGELSNFSVHGDVLGKNLLIIDDICEGGGTFTGLAKVLREKGARTVDLYITHGILSRGNKLEGIDTIYTTNSLGQPVGSFGSLNVIDILKENNND